LDYGRGWGVRNCDTFYRNDLCNILLWHLQLAGREAEKLKTVDFEESYRKLLKFQSKTEWKKFRACIDLFEDTEYAIVSAYMYQLGNKRNKNHDFGEKNIRLYGILNAFYLQMYSLIGLAKILHFPYPKDIEKEFKKLDIYKLRGIAGSHTVNFEWDSDFFVENNEINRVTSFRIVQAYLNQDGDRIVAIDENNISFEFNLLKALDEYIKLSTEYLRKIISHSIDSLVMKKADKANFNDRFSEILENLINYNSLNENQKFVNDIKKKFLK